jgi:hypothetical protein
MQSRFPGDSETEHHRRAVLHMDLLSICDIHRHARYRIWPARPAKGYGHFVSSRWRWKEVASPTSDFRPPINRNVGLYENRTERQPVDPAPDIDARFRPVHISSVSKGTVPVRRDRGNLGACRVTSNYIGCPRMVTAKVSVR